MLSGGLVTVALAGHAIREGFDHYDRLVAGAQSHKFHNMRLGGDVAKDGFERYARHVNAAQAQTREFAVSSAKSYGSISNSLREMSGSAVKNLGLTREQLGYTAREYETVAAAAMHSAEQQRGALASTAAAAHKAAGEHVVAAEKASGSWKKGFGTMATIGKWTSLAAVAVGGVSVKMASDFEKQMTLLRTQAFASRKEVEMLRKGVLALSPAVGIGPTKLAEGLYHIRSSGFQGADALNMLRVAAIGARTGNDSLESVSNALVGTMNALGMKGRDAAKAMGLLDAIVGHGNMRMKDLTAALGSGIMASARAAGLGLKDVGAALDTLTTRGVPAEQAATRLRMTFNLIANPTHKARAALAELGMTQETLAKDMRAGGLPAALEDLQKHMHGVFGHKLDVQETNAAVKEYQQRLLDAGVTGKALDKQVQMFRVSLGKQGEGAIKSAQLISEAFGGARMGTTMQLLMQNSDDVRKHFDQLGKTNGAKIFQQHWEITKKTFNQQVADMVASLQKLAVELGTTLIPIVQKAAHALDNFAKFLERHHKIAKAFAITLGGFLTLAVASFIARFLMRMGEGLKGIAAFGKAILSIPGKLGKAVADSEPFWKRQQAEIDATTVSIDKQAASAQAAQVEMGRLAATQEAVTAGGVVLPRGASPGGVSSVEKGGVLAEEEAMMMGGGRARGLFGRLRGLGGRMGGMLKGGGGGMLGMGMLFGGSALGGLVHKQTGSKLAGSVTSDTMMGAGMGMMFGPEGAAIGAAGGALLGIFSDKKARHAVEKFVSALWDGIKHLPKKLLHLGKEAGSAIWDGIKHLPKKMPHLIGEIIGFWITMPLRLGKIWFKAAKFAVEELWKVWKDIPHLIVKLLGFFLHLDGKLLDIGKKAGLGLLKGLWSLIKGIPHFLIEVDKEFLKLPGQLLKLGLKAGEQLGKGIVDAVKNAPGMKQILGLADKAGNLAGKAGHLVGKLNPFGATGGLVGAQGFASGGLVHPAMFGIMPPIGSTDSVPTWLTEGEFVMQKPAVDRHGVAKMSALNSGKDPVAEGAGKGMIVAASILIDSARALGIQDASSRATSTMASGSGTVSINRQSSLFMASGGLVSASGIANAPSFGDAPLSASEALGFGGRLGDTVDAVLDHTGKLSKDGGKDFQNLNKTATDQSQHLKDKVTKNIKDTHDKGSKEISDFHDESKTSFKDLLSIVTNRSTDIHDVVTKQFSTAHSSATKSVKALHEDTDSALKSTASSVSDHTSTIAKITRTNFGKARDAATSAGKSMNANYRGSLSSVDSATHTGVDYIANAVNDALKGLGGKEVKFHISKPPKFERGGPVGGVLGIPGQDTEEVYAAPGEAFLTHHHQSRYVEPALAIAKMMGAIPYGSLDEMFHADQTPHYMATGGKVKQSFKGGGYVFPFPKGAPVTWARIDQGQDLQSAPGTKVVAIAPGVVSSAHDRFGGFGDNYPIESITSGALKGRSVYYGHLHTTRTGRVNAGDVIGVTQRKADTWTAAPAGWLELGFLPYGNMEAGKAIAPILHALAGHRSIAGLGGGNLSTPKVGGPKGALRSLIARGLHDATHQGNIMIGDATASQGMSFAGISTHLGGSQSANRKLGQQMASRFGWGHGPEWAALDDIWGHLEGSWDENLRNLAGSPAYGIAQADPPSKYPPAGRPSAPPGPAKARAQIGWGLNYILGRYHDPIAAHKFRVAHGSYNKGGFVGGIQSFKTGGRKHPKHHPKQHKQSAAMKRLKHLPPILPHGLGKFSKYKDLGTVGQLDDADRAIAAVDDTYNRDERYFSLVDASLTPGDLSALLALRGQAGNLLVAEEALAAKSGASLEDLMSGDVKAENAVRAEATRVLKAINSTKSRLKKEGRRLAKLRHMRAGKVLSLADAIAGKVSRISDRKSVLTEHELNIRNSYRRRIRAEEGRYPPDIKNKLTAIRERYKPKLDAARTTAGRRSLEKARDSEINAVEASHRGAVRSHTHRIHELQGARDSALLPLQRETHHLSDELRHTHEHEQSSRRKYQRQGWKEAWKFTTEKWKLQDKLQRLERKEKELTGRSTEIGTTGLLGTITKDEGRVAAAQSALSDRAAALPGMVVDNALDQLDLSNQKAQAQATATGKDVDVSSIIPQSVQQILQKAGIAAGTIHRIFNPDPNAGGALSASALALELANMDAASQELYQQFGSNFAAPAALKAALGGGAFGPGVAAFGAAGFAQNIAAGLSGTGAHPVAPSGPSTTNNFNQTNHYATGPQDPHIHAQASNLEFENAFG